MKKILFLLLIVGVLMVGTVSIGEVSENAAQGITFSERDFGDSGQGGSTPDGGGGGGGAGPAPG